MRLRGFVGESRARGRRGRRGGAIGVILFGVVVLGISIALVRARPALTPAVAAPSALGDATAGDLIPITRPALLPTAGGRPVRVALVRDAASVPYFDDPREYDRALAAWATLLESTGAQVRRVAPSAAETDPSDVLAVVATPCLSAPARRAIQSATRHGRGVIFTGLTGTRDGGCREVGYGLIASLLEARGDTVDSAAERYLTVPQGSPLALDVPPGARVELKLAPHVVVRHAGRDAYYSDRDLNPLAVRETAMLDGAVIHDLSRGRVVYFGFEAGTVVDRAWERAIMGLLVRNAVALAAGIPLAGPDPWPAGHAVAAVIAQDVEDEFENARLALDTLRSAGMPGTFFVVSDLARQHEELTRAMELAGEVGTHTENHARLGGDLELQRRRLRTTQAELTRMLGHPVRGMRPPEEQFDQATLLAWKQAGGTYVFGRNNGRSPSPELVRIGDGPFVLIGRTADDDFLTVRRAQMTDPERLAAEQLAAYTKVRALGALYVMSYHSNMLARANTVGAVGIVARALKADTAAWLTTADSVSNWWLVRHAMRTSVSRGADGHLSLTVHNGAPVATPATSVTITLPNGERAVAASDSELTTPRPGTLRVRIPPLAQGGTHTTRIILEKGGRRER